MVVVGFGRFVWRMMSGIMIIIVTVGIRFGIRVAVGICVVGRVVIFVVRRVNIFVIGSIACGLRG